jgi:hypothetical protein
MDKIDHLMAVKNKNNKDSQKEQVTPKKYLKQKRVCHFIYIIKIAKLHFFPSTPKYGSG